MKAILFLILFISCSKKPEKKEEVNQLKSLSPASTIPLLESTELSKIYTNLKINTDSINSVRGRVRIAEALIAKQQVALAKKDTVWFSGFGGYGTKTAPYNVTAIKNEIANLKKTDSIIKASLAKSINDLSTIKGELPYIEKSMTDIRAALAVIRLESKDVPAIKAALATIRQDIRNIEITLGIP